MKNRPHSKRPGNLIFTIPLFTFILLMGLSLGHLLFAASPELRQVATPASSSGSPFVNGAGSVKNATLHDKDGNRISEGLQARLAELSGDDSVRVVVTLSVPGTAAAAQRAVGPFRLKREFTIIDGFAATMSVAQAKALARMRGVFRIEEDFRVSTMLDAANADFGTASARSVFGLTGAGVGICVVDTGVDSSHEQLNGGKVVGFVDYVNGLVSAYDDHGHGTHVAAIAAGDGSPTATYGGVAPGASIYAAKVLDSSGGGYESDVIAGVEWCADSARSSAGPGVSIISMSLGTEGGSDGLDGLSQAVNNAVAAGKTAVVAAGNSGDVPGTVGSPGAAEGAVTVGAAAEWSAPVAAANHSDGIFLAWFSSRGPTADGRTKPDIISPGVSITSARAGTTDGYITYSGTSMATPFVSGTVALALQYNSFTPSQVKNLLMSTAQDRGASGKDNDWGAGLLDGYAFVAQAQNTLDDPTVFPSSRRVSGSVTDNGAWQWSFDVTESDLDVPIGLALTIDGQAECALELWGICFGWEWSPDLDAELIGPDGTTVLTESTCMADSECGSGGRQETLHVMPAAAGTYTVRVYPFSGSPNNGKGGSFTLDVSTGPVGDSSGGGTETDIIAPTVTDFDLPDEHNELSVPVLKFAASDNFGVMGYLLTETSSTPDIEDPAWSTSPPTEYVFDTAGTWTLYAWAKDAAGNISSGSNDSVDVILDTPSAPNTLHVGDLDADGITNRSLWQASVTVTVHDASHSPVVGVTVSGVWSGGFNGNDSCITGAGGTCTMSSDQIKKNKGEIDFTVADVSLDSYTYEAADNHDPDGDSNGTDVAVFKP